MDNLNLAKSTILKTVVLALTLTLSMTANAGVKRSQSVKADFQRQHPCPANGNARGACPGYVKDHIKALDCGGADAVHNLQWQTIAEGKAKDKWERKECARH